MKMHRLKAVFSTPFKLAAATSIFNQLVELVPFGLKYWTYSHLFIRDYNSFLNIQRGEREKKLAIYTLWKLDVANTEISWWLMGALEPENDIENKS